MSPIFLTPQFAFWQGRQYVPEHIREQQAQRFGGRIEAGMSGINPIPPTPKKIREVQHEVHRAMQPYVRMKVDILNASPHTITIKPGQIPEYVYPPEVQAQLDEIDRLSNEMRDEILQRAGLP